MLSPQGMGNFHRPWGGLSELMQPCSCVCHTASEAQLIWDQRQANPAMLLVVSFCIVFCFWVDSFSAKAGISKQHNFVELSHVPKRKQLTLFSLLS